MNGPAAIDREERAMSKNVIIIMSDEQRWDTLGCNGSKDAVTPNIDKLAGRGVSMNGYTPYPLCCPSRTSMWTGLLPHRHDVNGNWRLINPEQQDKGLFSAFAEAGYHTIYTGKWHVPGTTPQRFGIADVSAIPAIIDGRDRGQYIEEYREYATRQGYDLLPGNVSNLTAKDVAQLKIPGKAPCGEAEIKEEHFLETWQTGQLIEALERRPAGKPFIAVCCYSAPHFPMIVPAPYHKLVSPEDVSIPPNFREGIEGKPDEAIQSGYFRKMMGLSEREWRDYIAHYIGLCALMDTQVGRVLDYVEQTGLADDIIIVYTSDHGDMMGSHGLNMKGYPLHYEEALKVPLVISVPGKEHAPAATEQLVSLMDIMPTLAELTGIRLNGSYDGIDGNSFASLLDPSLQDSSIEGLVKEYVIAETFLVDGDEGDSGVHRDTALFHPDTHSINLSIRTKQYRYVFRWNDIDELYDHRIDPYENANIWRETGSEAIIRPLQQLLLEELRTNPNLYEHVKAKMQEKYPD
jgi:arylsulfatase A-like enzyme